MSAMTSKARPRWRSSTRVYRVVASLSVPALTSAPIASKIWSISSEPKRSVPRKSMCSSRCVMPASSSASAAEPAAIQNPSAAERTPGMRSLTTRVPESSVVIRSSGWVLNRGRAGGAGDPSHG